MKPQYQYLSILPSSAINIKLIQLLHYFCNYEERTYPYNISLLKIHLIILLLFNVVIGYGKDHEVDSLLNVIYNSPKDSNTVHLALKISDKLQFKSLDYTIRFAKESLLISEQLQWIYGMGRSNEKIGRAYWNLGKYDSALYYHFRALNDYKKGKYWKNYWDIVVMIGQDYANSSQFNLAIQYLNIALNAY